MKHIFVAISFVLFSLLILMACNKTNENQTSDAIISWTGDYAVDGCGFFVTINNHTYKPIDEASIDQRYKVESTNVVVSYQLVDSVVESSCGDFITPTLTDGIKIISISQE